jgi:hypothetical protein
MTIEQILEDNKFDPPPQERSKRINYFRDAVLFLRKMNETKKNPKINKVIDNMIEELNNLTK